MNQLTSRCNLLAERRHEYLISCQVRECAVFLVFEVAAVELEIDYDETCLSWKRNYIPIHVVAEHIWHQLGKVF